MIISIDRKNKIDEVQQLFLVKALSRLEIQKNILDLKKSIYAKTPAHILVNSEKLNGFLLRLEVRQECLLSPLLFLLDVLA